MSDHQFTVITEINDELKNQLDAMSKKLESVSKKLDKLAKNTLTQEGIPIPGRTSVKAFSKRFCIPVSTIYQKARSGEIPPLRKDGTRSYMENEDILKWLEQTNKDSFVY